MRDSDRAYNAILKQLAYGKLKCGQAIDDEALQAEIGVGKTPLREALFRLVQDGYITSGPRRGMFVTAFDLGQLESLLEIRAILAGYLSQQLVHNARDKDIERCETEMRQLIQESGDKNIEAVFHMDRRYHEMLEELCGDNILSGILSKLELMSSMALAPRSRHYFINEETVKAEYLDTFRYLKDRDMEPLEATLKKHIPRYILQRV